MITLDESELLLALTMVDLVGVVMTVTGSPVVTAVIVGSMTMFQINSKIAV